MDWSALLLLSLATFAGALVQAATGFGFAIIAAPVFLWVMNSTAAIAVLVALHVVQSAIVVPRLWPKASRWHLKRLALGAVAGCPFGVWLLTGMDVRALKLAVGVVILGVIGLLVWRECAAGGRARPAGGKSSGGTTLATGVLSGALTALLVMPGPPLMVYFMRDRHAGDAVRALSLSFFALCYVAVTAAFALLGMLDGRALWMAAMLAPAVLLGTVAGLAAAGLFSDAELRLALLALLFLSGIGAIASAVWPGTP